MKTSQTVLFKILSFYTTGNLNLNPFTIGKENVYNLKPYLQPSVIYFCF